MFKDRRLLIGLGAGMICGSLLLQLMLFGERAAEPLTEPELRRQAERAGYELIPRGAMANGTEEGGSDSAAEPGSSAEKKQDPPSEVEQEAKIKVVYGSGSRDIAKQLAEAGIVESAEEFERYVATQKKQGKLRTGTFRFPVPSTKEEALRILTSKPNG